MNPDLDEVAPRLVLLGAAVGAVALGALTVTVGWLTNIGLLLASVGTLVAAAVLVQWLIQAQRRVHWGTVVTAPDARRGADSRVNTLRHTVERAAASHERGNSDLHALLRGLAADRLEDRHAVDLESQPEQASALLGAELAAYLAQPPPRRTDPAALDRFVTRLEELT